MRIKDRDTAAAVLMTLARHKQESFCLCFVYDYDSEFLEAVAKKIGARAEGCEKFLRRLRRVCRRLEQAGILSGRLSSCHKEYIGEPHVLKSYQFSEPYQFRLAPDLHPHYEPMGKVETELSILLDRAYPQDY